MSEATKATGTKLELCGGPYTGLTIEIPPPGNIFDAPLPIPEVIELGFIGISGVEKPGQLNTIPAVWRYAITFDGMETDENGNDISDPNTPIKYRSVESKANKAESMFDDILRDAKKRT